MDTPLIRTLSKAPQCPYYRGFTVFLPCIVPPSPFLARSNLGGRIINEVETLMHLDGNNIC